LLARYRHEVTTNMGNCKNHRSRMEFLF
jgi:hypothetical protein